MDVVVASRTLNTQPVLNDLEFQPHFEVIILLVDEKRKAKIDNGFRTHHTKLYSY